MDDSKIISLLEERNEDALAAIQDKYFSYLKRIAMNVLANEADADECVNETVFRVWNKVPPDKPVRLSAYLAKIVRNIAIDTYRANRNRSNRISEYPDMISELEDLFPPASGTEDVVDHIVLRDTLLLFLKTVSPKEKKIFVRRFFFFDSVRAIAEMYGVSESSVKVTLFRIRTKLRKFLEKEGYRS